MNKDKLKVAFIYRHELAREIAKHIFIREYKRGLPEGDKSMYKLDKDGDIRLDENFDPVYSDKFIEKMESNKVVQQMTRDYFHYYDLIVEFVRLEDNAIPPKSKSLEEIDKDVMSFRKKLRNFFRMF